MTELELRAHKIEAVGAIENLMALHSYYHAADMNREELDNCWSQEREAEVIWSQNFGRWQGLRKKLYPMYAGDNKYTDAEWLKSKIIKAHPEMEEAIKDLDGRALAEMPVHVLASPVIEIAEDGMSAKGLWYTPGFALRHDYVKGTVDVAWMWEKYGADFVWENGEWKFLHIQIGMDIMANYGESWAEPKPMGGPGGPGGPGPAAPPPEEKKPEKKEVPVGKDGKKLKVAPSMGGGMACPPDGPGKYSIYSRTRVPSEYPKIPEPYTTLSETFSY